MTIMVTNSCCAARNLYTGMKGKGTYWKFKEESHDPKNVNQTNIKIDKFSSKLGFCVPNSITLRVNECVRVCVRACMCVRMGEVRSRQVFLVFILQAKIFWGCQRTICP